MKQEVNYILHHKNVNMKMMNDDLSCIDVALYNALFLYWNRCNWDEELSVNRGEIMKISKIGSAHTYTKSLKTLHEKKYIIYKPSFNPLIGSRITIVKFGKGSGKSSDIGIDKGSGNAYGNGRDTLYKQVNNITIEQVKQINILLAFCETLQNEDIDLLVSFAENGQLINKLKEERKKVAPKKETKPVTEFWKSLTDVWINFYKDKFQDEPKFNGVSAKSLKTLVDNLKKDSTSKGFIWDEANAINCLEMFLSMAFKNQWLKDNFLLKNLASQYDAIKASKNGSSKPQTGGQVEASGLLNKVGQMFGTN